jgi:hypothetical protein
LLTLHVLQSHAITVVDLMAADTVEAIAKDAHLAINQHKSQIL